MATITLQKINDPKSSAVRRIFVDGSPWVTLHTNRGGRYRNYEFMQLGSHLCDKRGNTIKFYGKLEDERIADAVQKLIDEGFLTSPEEAQAAADQRRQKRREQQAIADAAEAAKLRERAADVVESIRKYTSAEMSDVARDVCINLVVDAMKWAQSQ